MGSGSVTSSHEGKGRPLDGKLEGEAPELSALASTEKEQTTHGQFPDQASSPLSWSMWKKSKQVILLLGRKPSDTEKNDIFVPHSEVLGSSLKCVNSFNHWSPKAPWQPNTSHCQEGRLLRNSVILFFGGAGGRDGWSVLNIAPKLYVAFYLAPAISSWYTYCLKNKLNSFFSQK